MAGPATHKALKQSAATRDASHDAKAVKEAKQSTQAPHPDLATKTFERDPRLAVAEIGSHKAPFIVRLIEVILAGTALIVLSPLMLLLAILIRRGTPGPALFVQKRVGVNGKIFNFYKFRSCYYDSPQKFPELFAYRYTENDIRTLNLKVDNDPRVTKQGLWLRKTTLDELPNFWNVVTGDVALVGPRPEVPQMLPYYSGEMLRKFSVRPGITGMAQISGRGHLSFCETVDLDVEYVKTRSLALDLKILALTAYKAITQEGAR